MRHRVALFLLLALLGACAGPGGKKFTVSFQPYSADLDPQAQQTIQAAVAFAKARPLAPVTIDGYASRPNPGDIPTLKQERVVVVRDALEQAGIDRLRIEVLGNGILYPDGVPDQPAEQVDVNVGL